ncbi:MAG: hypothetical protein H6R01_129 [Burkholderiaceae bacterium]|nr:hypothetical protein [Burkholderiaceae bacterium]
MPLPPATGRKLKHTRSVNIEIYSREDELWDIDARLVDTKTHDVKLTIGKLPANQPIHDLWLRLIVDRHANIVDVETAMDSVPFTGYCDVIAPAYKKLIGLNVLKGFRQGVRERFSETDGCSHLNELSIILPTAAIQVFAFEKRHESAGQPQEQKPFELDHCHALRCDGPAVAVFYPRWANSK